MTLPGDTLLSQIYARHRSGSPNPKDNDLLVRDVMSRHFDRYDSFVKLQAKLDWFCYQHERMDALEKARFMEWLSARYRAAFGYEMLG